jgi:hypothetical protein
MSPQKNIAKRTPGDYGARPWPRRVAERSGSLGLSKLWLGLWVFGRLENQGIWVSGMSPITVSGTPGTDHQGLWVASLLVVQSATLMPPPRCRHSSRAWTTRIITIVCVKIGR